jgi:CheY-like chemotaxis protein
MASSQLVRILIIDDDPLFTHAIRRALEREFDVEVRASARDALELLSSGNDRFDVILCDLMMPEMSGMDLYVRLRETQPAVADGMIFITGDALAPTTQAFLDGVPNQRLEKPFDMRRLRELVRGQTG